MPVFMSCTAHNVAAPSNVEIVKAAENCSLWKNANLNCSLNLTLSFTLANFVVSEMTYTVSSGTLNSSIPLANFWHLCTKMFCHNGHIKKINKWTWHICPTSSQVKVGTKSVQSDWTRFHFQMQSLLLKGGLWMVSEQGWICWILLTEFMNTAKYLLGQWYGYSEA